MADRPSAYPDWATVLNIDPVSGQANYLEPPTPKKSTGFDRSEVPPRQWVNWLLRENGRWVRYFDQGEIYTDTTLSNIENLPYTPSQYELILRKPSANVVHGLLKITVSFAGSAGAFSVWNIANIPAAFRPTADVQTTMIIEEGSHINLLVTATDDGDLEFRKISGNYSDPGGLVTYEYSSFMYTLKT